MHDFLQQEQYEDLKRRAEDRPKWRVWLYRLAVLNNTEKTIHRQGLLSLEVLYMRCLQYGTIDIWDQNLKCHNFDLHLAKRLAYQPWLPGPTQIFVNEGQKMHKIDSWKISRLGGSVNQIFFYTIQTVS